MSKAKKGGKAKKADKKKKEKGDVNEAEAAGAVTLENMVRTDEEKQLAVECRQLKNKYFIEERLLNEFQQNVVKLESILMMEKQKSLEVKSKIRDKLREKQELNDEQEYELKSYQERVRHLLGEHQNQMTQLRIEYEGMLKTLESGDRDQQHALQSNIRSLLIKQKENTQQHNELLNEYKTLHHRNVASLREEYKMKIDHLYSNYNEKFSKLRKSSRQDRKQKIKFIESAKNKHINNLMKKHKQSLNDIKNYYSDIIHSNLDLIKSLKSEILEVQKKEKAKEQQMLEISNINKSLSKPLKEYLNDIETLKATLKTYEKEKEILATTQENISKLQSEYDDLQWKHEILLQKYEQESEEYNVLRAKYENSLLENTQKKQLKSLILDESIKQIHSKIEKQDINFNEILSSMNIQQTTMDNVMATKLDDVIKVKEQTIKHMENKTLDAKQKYNAMITYYQSLMHKYNIPVSELGFTPTQI